LSGCRLFFGDSRLLPFDMADDLRDLSKAFDGSKPVHTMETHRGQPSLRHGTAPIPFDVAFAFPHRCEHTLNGIRGVERLAPQRGHLQPMDREQFLKGFPEGIGR